MSSFSWVPIYEELADRLAEYRRRQVFLVEFLNAQRAAGLPATPMTDRDAEGRSFQLEELDPFTFIGAANRRTTENNRIALLEAMKNAFKLASPLPSDFSGIPVLHPQNSWFFGYKKYREPDDVAQLWDVFEHAIQPDPLESPEFAAAFDAAYDNRGAGRKLTLGLFWIRPRIFLNLDSRMREHLGLRAGRRGEPLSAAECGGVHRTHTRSPQDGHASRLRGLARCIPQHEGCR